MNASINNNRKLLKNGKRVPFTKMNGGSSKKQNYKPYVLPYTEPHKLRRIRLKVRREYRKLLVKKIIIGCVTLVLMILYIRYLTAKG
jgi:hypothetical protein